MSERKDIQAEEFIAYFNRFREGKGCVCCGHPEIDPFVESYDDNTLRIVGFRGADVMGGYWSCYSGECTRCGFVHTFFSEYLQDWVDEKRSNQGVG